MTEEKTDKLKRHLHLFYVLLQICVCMHNVCHEKYNGKLNEMAHYTEIIEAAQEDVEGSKVKGSHFSDSPSSGPGIFSKKIIVKLNLTYFVKLITL